MKKLFIIPSAAILLFAFGDTSKESYSQEFKKSAIIQKKEKEINRDSITLEAKLDSLHCEISRTKEMVAEREQVIEFQKGTRTELKNIYQLASKALVAAERLDNPLPMVFVVYPRKSVSELPVSLKEANIDTTIHQEHKRSFFDKVLFRHRK